MVARCLATQLRPRSAASSHSLVNGAAKKLADEFFKKFAVSPRRRDRIRTLSTGGDRSRSGQPRRPDLAARVLQPANDARFYFEARAVILNWHRNWHRMV